MHVLNPWNSTNQWNILIPAGAMIYMSDFVMINKITSQKLRQTICELIVRQWHVLLCDICQEQTALPWIGYPRPTDGKHRLP